MNYCTDPFSYQRRQSREVKVGGVGIGGSNPIRVQSMITCDTMDTEASIGQTMDLAAVGCEIVRITAPTVKDAANLQHIVRGLRERGCGVPIVADIHFKPEAAMEAAKWVEKVRINPGNYADSKKFKIIEYTDEQYAAELERIRQRFSPLVQLCKERGVAMRIGTNHGSLSDRIMNRYGDTPLGMVESALEFARIARDLDYHAFVFSMKSSNPKVMIAAYRLLVARLAELDGMVGTVHPNRPVQSEPEGRGQSPLPRDAQNPGDWGQSPLPGDAQSGGGGLPEGRLGSIAPTLPVAQVDELEAEDADSGRGGSPNRQRTTWNYPIHLGVTEAGEGEDARIKSAIGIGSLLADGIGDTIRVSLTEDSIHEIPVAKALIQTGKRIAETGREKSERWAGRFAHGASTSSAERSIHLSFDPFSYQRRASDVISVAAVSDRREQPGDDQRPPLQVKLGGTELVRVVVREEQFEKIAHKIDRMGDYKPEIVCENASIMEIDPRDDDAITQVNSISAAQFVTVKDGIDLPVISAFRLLAAKLEARHPILLKDMLVGTVDHNGRLGSIAPTVPQVDKSDAGDGRGGSPEPPGRVRAGLARSLTSTSDFLQTLLTGSTNIGSLLCDGIGDAILVRGEEAPGQSLRLSYNILQAAGSRIFKTDYVACPSCGRTLFNLQTTTARIKEATLHLKGVKIAIMGCIVNGPGEMADADFGYVGGAPGKVNLYVGKQPVKFNIPEAEAVDRLKDLIREHGKWAEPAAQPSMAEATV
ncbi:MAG: (E)-4-hydroxy-3-methylbut-2-enyl-diphosphate synthase [Verrucomicrobiota bacterium]|jgi:(E)-4-hydroxy-3-methylbut-2-enyl-diphosphate synthase